MKTEIELQIVRDQAFLDRRAVQMERAKTKRGDAVAMAFGVCILPAVAALFCLPMWFAVPDRSPTFGVWLWNVCLSAGMLACLIASIYLLITQLMPLTIRFNTWRKTQEHWFCPCCRRHLPTLLSWECPRCEQINGGNNDHSYFGCCSRCDQSPDAIICPQCRRTIALAKDGPILSIAIVAARSIVPSENHDQFNDSDSDSMSSFDEE